MTKKDYELIAQEIRLLYNPIRELPVGYGVRLTALNLRTAFAKQNPKFDSKKFLTACGMGDE